MNRAHVLPAAVATVMAAAILAPPLAPAQLPSSAAGVTARGGELATLPLVTHVRPPRAPFIPLAPSNGFQGLGPTEQYGGSFYSFTPGEPSVAVGPNDIVETVNDAAAVYDRSGHLLQELDFGTFWGGTDANPTFCTDPRTLYLASGQFAFSCSTTGASTNPMRFAISKTADPTAGWYIYAAPDTAFLDQDKIEATSDKFIIAGNTGTTEVMYVYNLADVESGVPHPQVRKLTATKSNIFQAVVEQTPASQAYFVASFPGNVLYLATVTGTPAAASVALKQTLVKSTDFAAPQNPQVPGGTYDGGDGRILDAVYEVETSDSKPVIQYSSTRLCGTRDCLTSARIDLSGAKPLLSYDHLVGEPGWDYTYGAVGLDGAGDVFETYSRSNGSTTPEAAVTGPAFDVVMQPSSGGALASCSTDPCERWGDYLAAAVDPSDPTSVWVSGLYQTGTSGYSWGTVIARVSNSTYSLPTVTASAATSITGVGARLPGTVNPNGVATTYHFDYGLTSGYDTATSETSAGSGTSPVNVSTTLTGLQPGTTYHYRLVATTASGSAVTADRTFKTKSASITSVQFTGTSADPTVTVTGANLGTQPVGQPAGCGTTGDDFGMQLWFQDTSQGWTAGQNGDCIGLVVSSYSSTQVVYQFGSGYGTGANQFGTANSGDQYTLSVQGRSFSGTVTYP